MSISTSVARHYSIRLGAFMVVCALLGAWGAYDLWVKIPAQRDRAEQYLELKTDIDRLEARSREQAEAGFTLTPEEVQRYEDAQAQLAIIAPEGNIPQPPSKFDELTQWFFIACFLGIPQFALMLAAARKRVFTLDESGGITSPEGHWAADEIADIDMGRWMSRSIAWVVHQDGRRLKMDDYVHKNTDRIVGVLSSRFYPESWTDEAKPVKTDDEAPPEDTEAPEALPEAEDVDARA